VIGRLKHVAIAVPDIDAAAAKYRDGLGATVSAPSALPAHGVSVVFVEFGETRIELMEPLGDHSPIANFLARNPTGGIHHLCFEVSDLSAAVAHLIEAGGRILGDGEPATGAHGKPVVFVDPQSFHGVLIELEEAG
jgi:methylmalonyl-CoA/ethylmalonyl-CoA epimerase